LGEFFNSFFVAGIRPDQTFSYLVPVFVPPLLTIVILYLAMVGLLQRINLFLAALGGLIIFGVFYRMVYDGGYRHQGLYLVFLLFLYWLFIDSSGSMSVTGIKRRLYQLGFFLALGSLVLGNVYLLSNKWKDIHHERSSSKAFAEFLNNSETYRDAILIPEPDYAIESLTYYANNPIYLPREHRFGKSVSWTTDVDVQLSLGQLLSIARDIQTQYGKPVLIVFGHVDVDLTKPGVKYFSYNKVFVWNSDEVAEFKESTTRVARFISAYTDENYRIYALK
jgi:hypothetical protein